MTESTSKSEANVLLKSAAEAVSPPDASEDFGLRMNFSGAVAREFEEKVISNQIPGYESMRERCLQLSLQFLRDGTNFVDIGSSTGKTIRDLIEYLGESGDSRSFSSRFTGLDLESDMIHVADSLFDEMLKKKDFSSNGTISTVVDGITPEIGKNVSFVQADLREGLRHHIPNIPTSVISSIFTLQFVPMEFRPRILGDIYDMLEPGGVFLMAEKVLIPDRRIDKALSLAYYDVKSKNGMTDREILLKRSRLENYLLPLTTAANIELLCGAGFSAQAVHPVWRDLQFEMYMAVK